jgi:hypothetical protein
MCRIESIPVTDCELLESLFCNIYTEYCNGILAEKDITKRGKKEKN